MSRVAARQSQLEEGKKKGSLDKRVRFSRVGEIVKKNKEREVRGLSKQVKNNYLGIISSHGSVCMTAVSDHVSQAVIVVITVN